ncbi:hypothetical protein BJY01DRAFT_206741 [Aspergillus pseudoustus]|uniref:Uncharacterized protein n=1 Tax=Aspergillus pseudoustus TaxID=1810923 RepID=A0ABR4KMG6_9EURO
MLSGCEVGIEPLTWNFDAAGEYRRGFENGRTEAVPIYRTRFLDRDILLPEAPCIDRLYFSWPVRSRGLLSAMGRHGDAYCPALSNSHPPTHGLG